MNKKLYKSANDVKISGVCGGIAEYFGIDPTIVRLAWFVITLIGGCGIIAYIACAIIMPKQPYSEYVDYRDGQPPNNDNNYQDNNYYDNNGNNRP